MKPEPPGRAGRPLAASSVAPVLPIRALPASLPGTDHRTPTTRPHYERDSEPLELQPRAPLVALQRELDQPVEQLRVRNPGGLEELGVDARRREARDRIQLVDEHVPVVPNEEVHARHTVAFGDDEALDRQPLDALDLLLRDPRPA